MVKINLNNITSSIIGLDDKLIKLISNKLTYQVCENRFKKTNNFLFDSINNTTYTGLVPHIVKILKDNKVKFTINDLRKVPNIYGKYTISSEFKLRDYQEDILNKISSRSIIMAATGAGKTIIMAGIIEKYNVKNVVMLAPSVSLAIQNSKEISKFLGVEVGVYCGTIKNPKDITVCTPESAPDFLLNKADMLLVDEVHCIAADTMFECTKKCNAYYRFGCSASPWRDDGKDLLIEAAINIRKSNLYINASSLILKKQLVPCEINFIDIKKIYNNNGDYHELYNNAIVNNEYRNGIIRNKAIDHVLMGESVLILFKNIAHGEKIYNLISQAIGKERVALVDGSTEIEEREKIFDKVRNGEIRVLIGSTIADTGLSISNLSTLILAGGGKSSIKAFQRIGRVLRLSPGKTKATVYDFTDFTPILKKHSDMRKELYKIESEWKINNI